MSFKDVARDLYRAQQRVAQLKAALEQAPPAQEAELLAQLADAEAEQRYLQKVINGRKASPLIRRPR